MAGSVQSSKHQSWSSRLAFIFATIGFSVGLGNIWRFPYLAGESGGGAFVLIYFACVILIGLPIVMAEMAVGRRGGMTPVGTLAKLAEKNGAGLSGRNIWKAAGVWVMLIAFLIESFYCVIGGWTLHYIYLAASGALTGIDASQSKALFEALLADPYTLIFWQVIFLLLNVLVVARGLQSGIEKAVTILMPVLFILLSGLALYGLMAGEGVKAISFLFAPDFSVVNGQTVLDAMGQAFFSVGVGMAAMMTYGAYLPKDVRVPSTSTIIALSDTAVALIAGLAIFPFVFALGLSPSGGPGLVFVTLPAALSGFAGGFATLAFFILLAVAALTSSIALFEVCVSWAEEQEKPRRSSSAVVAVLLLVVGLGTVFSFNIAADFYPLSFVPALAEKTMFDLVDGFTASIGLPIGGLVAAVAAGWLVSKTVMAEELHSTPQQILFKLWHIAVRFVLPIVILVLLLTGAQE